MYIDLTNLTTDQTFLGRTAYAASKYATYIKNEASNAPNHAARLNYATRTLLDPMAAARRIVTAVCQDANVQTNLGEVTDAQLQLAAENAANGVIASGGSYTEWSEVAAEIAFQKRLAMAVAKFAVYILNESPTTPNHNGRYRWAQGSIMNTQGVAQAIANAVVLNSSVNGSLMGATDAELQTAVETQVGLLLL